MLVPLGPFLASRRPVRVTQEPGICRPELFASFYQQSSSSRRFQQPYLHSALRSCPRSTNMCFVESFSGTHSTSRRLGRKVVPWGTYLTRPSRFPDTEICGTRAEHQLSILISGFVFFVVCGHLSRPHCATTGHCFGTARLVLKPPRMSAS